LAAIFRRQSFIFNRIFQLHFIGQPIELAAIIAIDAAITPNISAFAFARAMKILSQMPRQLSISPHLFSARLLLIFRQYYDYFHF